MKSVQVEVRGEANNSESRVRGRHCGNCKWQHRQRTTAQDKFAPRPKIPGFEERKVSSQTQVEDHEYSENRGINRMHAGYPCTRIPSVDGYRLERTGNQPSQNVATLLSQLPPLLLSDFRKPLAFAVSLTSSFEHAALIRATQSSTARGGQPKYYEGDRKLRQRVSFSHFTSAVVLRYVFFGPVRCRKKRIKNTIT